MRDILFAIVMRIEFLNNFPLRLTLNPISLLCTLHSNSKYFLKDNVSMQIIKNWLIVAIKFWEFNVVFGTPRIRTRTIFEQLLCYAAACNIRFTEVPLFTQCELDLFLRRGFLICVSLNKHFYFHSNRFYLVDLALAKTEYRNPCIFA